MSKVQLRIRRWFDRHLHIRKNEMLRAVLPCTLNQRATGAVLMGNLGEKHQTSTIARTDAYREEVMEALPLGSDFNPFMTLFLTDDITPAEVVEGFERGSWGAAKLYVSRRDGTGGTTNSAHGVKDILGRYKVFEAMEKIGMPLLGHFEAVEQQVDEFDREIVSAERDLVPILQHFPGLNVVVEHLTDGDVADIVAGAREGVYATVTAHHLMLNRNALFEGGMNPIHWCKPVLKRETHRLRVRKHVTSGNPRFGAGTDSAPHDLSQKTKCCGCAAGIFTAPCAVELYTTVFERDGKIDNLGPFLSENFLHVYGRKPSDEMMVIEHSPYTIPKSVNNVQVFMGGEVLPWRLVG